MAIAQKEPWTEIFDGGSQAAELASFRTLAQAMLDIQEKNREAAGADHAMRTLHAKIIAGISDATLQVDEWIPECYRVEHFTPGAIIKGVVRFSNAAGMPKSDASPDMRGIAMKLFPSAGVPHDLLMTNWPVSHARNARQFVDFALLAMGDKASFQQRLEQHFGADEARRMLYTVSRGMRPSVGLQYEAFWNRGAMLWGEQPVRLILRPQQAAGMEAAVSANDGLRDALAAYLCRKPVTYRLAVQPFVSEALTPIEDAAVEWTETVSPPVELATLVLPQQNILDEDGMASMEQVDQLSFNPWHAPAAFRPLGNINRARGEVYGRSAQRWSKS